jgi:hypothetical protein
MKNSLGIFTLLIILFSGCEKESIDKEETADKYVGKYGYTLTADTFFENGEMTILKISANKITIMRSDSVVRFFSVFDNSITEDAGNEAKHIPLPGTGWANFVENSTGIMNDNELLIDGVFSSPFFDSISFKVVATRK